MNWSTVNNVPASIDTMLLLTDGSVMAHGNQSSNWYRLIPDNSGSYANGTWKQTASMPNDSNLPATQNGPTYAPQFFGSAVLQDGTVLVFGGEYNVKFCNTCAVDALEVQLYDPVTDSWTILPTPSGWANIGDPASTVLADGRVLFGSATTSQVVTFDPQTQAYFSTSAKNDPSSEETFTLLPNGDVLTVQCSNAPNYELYTPPTDTWSQEGSTGVSLPQPCTNQVAEIGPAILLPNGNVFCIGADGNTAVYTPGAAGTAGTWSNGPTLVDSSNNTMYPMDAPAVLLTDGTVLLTASPSPPCSYPGPTTFYIYDPSTNKAAIQSSSSTPTNSGSPCFTGRFLLLPSGEVLFSNQSGTVSILSSVGNAQASWAPTITNCPGALILGHTYQIFGTQFNGLSQACSYGDDAQMATNYPIVRLQDGSGNVYYLRTANHSTMGVATGTTPVSTFVSVPTDIPPGEYNLFVVANGIPSAPFAVSVGTQDLVIRLEMTNFTVGEVTAQQGLIGAGNFADALEVEVEGFSQDAIGTTVPNVTTPISDLTYASTGPGSPTDLTLPPDQPQRFTFPFQAQFSDTKMFTSTDQTLVVSATFAPPAGNSVSNNAQIVLQETPNPYMFHGGSGPGAEWYLSVDIKVFQLKAGDKLFGLTAGQGTSPQDGATTWIQTTIDNLNNDPAALGPVFDGLPSEEDTAALNLLQTDNSGNNIYNFALARVRYQDSQVANNVRLFFRMFAAQQVTSAYDPTTSYFSYKSGSTVVPVLGVQGDEIVTIPFFAAPRVDVSQPLSSQPDPKNIALTINPDPLGAVVDTYYGCWLDINQPNDLRFPDRMVGNTPSDYQYGPYNSFDNLVSILQLVRSQHQCLVCEVSFDPDPITVGDDPSNTDKLAQRNLAFVSSANPGVDDQSRLIPQTFELKPTPTILKLDQKPDELVIDWGNVPPGSTAQIYLPGTTSAAILAWAATLYTTHNLRAFDSHTIEVNTGGTTYIPIPKGTNIDFAGLLSIQLPLGVKKGDSYEVLVRQITSDDYTQPITQVTKRGAKKSQAIAEPPPPSQYAWRRTSGIFKLTIPVDTKAGLLENEERYYAILQFIAKSIPLASRWYPIFQRYLTQVAGRVEGFGGNPGKILPSGTGSLPGDKHPAPCRGDHLVEFVGKVAGLIYNHFGDFEGFVLEEGCNRVRRFRSTECRLANILGEAWKDRATVRVITDSCDESCMLEVVVGGEPPTCCC